MALDKVSVAILSWNGRVHLETCLEALAEQADPGVAWEILVLDNGSSDGTADWLARHHPGVRCVRSETNLGFCAGNNRLVEAAQGDAVALLNNDTRPEPDWLAALVDGLAGAPADVAAVSGKIVDWKGEKLDFGRGVMTFDGHAFQLDFRRPLAASRVPRAGEELFFAEVHLHGGPAPVRRFLPDLIDLIWNRRIDPGKVFDLQLPLAEVAEGYRAMDERRAIKTLLWP